MSPTHLSGWSKNWAAKVLDGDYDFTNWIFTFSVHKRVLGLLRRMESDCLASWPINSGATVQYRRQAILDLLSTKILQG